MIFRLFVEHRYFNLERFKIIVCPMLLCSALGRHIRSLGPWRPMSTSMSMSMSDNISKTFSRRATPRLGVVTVNVVIAVTSISNTGSNTCKLAELVYLWQIIHYIHFFVETAYID